MPYTVKFATGQSVNFANSPTSQDIDEVATKLGINKAQASAPSASSPATPSSQSVPGLPQPPQQPTPLQSPASTPSDSQSDQQPEKLGDLSGVARGFKGTFNFLFPVLGDIYHAFKGDQPPKSVLQVAGDTALSALGFIPGLGELGNTAKAAKLAAEGGEVASKAGLLSKVAGSSVAKGAAAGYGAGVASNLSQGKGIGESLAPNVNTVAGTLFGAGAPAAMKGLSSVAEKVVGMNPQIATELARMGSNGDPKDVELFDKYINAAKTHSSNLRTTSPLTMAADTLDNAAAQISDQTDKAGAAVGAAKEAAKTVQLKPLNDVGNSFWKEVQDRYGLNLMTGKNGKIVVKQVPDSMIQIAPGDVARIRNIAQQLSDLHMNPNPTVKQATEVMQNLNNLVDHSKADVYGHTNDPLEGLIKHTAGNLNEVVRASSPELAKANDAFSGLKSLQDEIQGMAGKNLQKGELLMRRVFSGDKSGEVQDFFKKIQDATGVDLVKHAVLAKNAIESVGSPADRTLLEQMISGATEGKGGMFQTGVNVAKGLIKKTMVNPEKVSRNIITGKDSTKLKGLITKGAIEASRGVKGLTGQQ